MSYRRAAFDFFYRDDKLDPVFINSTFDPRRPLSDHTGKVREELPR